MGVKLALVAALCLLAAVPALAQKSTEDGLRDLREARRCHGKAVYQAGGEPDQVRFICPHGGLGKGTVFVYTLPR